MNNNKEYHAVFVVAIEGEYIAATTRTDGSIGLPGGKLDPGEDLLIAAKRESSEEGWNLSISSTILHTDIVDGKLVAWLKGEILSNQPDDWKEKYRNISPVLLRKKLLTGLGNEFIHNI